MAEPFCKMRIAYQSHFCLLYLHFIWVIMFRNEWWFFFSKWSWLLQNKTQCTNDFFYFKLISYFFPSSKCDCYIFLNINTNPRVKFWLYLSLKNNKFCRSCSLSRYAEVALHSIAEKKSTKQLFPLKVLNE